MVAKLRTYLRKLILGYRSCSDSYLTWLKNKGVSVGMECKIFTPFNTNIDVLHPHMLSIGNNVIMTGPVTVLCHDYSTIAAGGGYRLR